MANRKASFTEFVPVGVTGIVIVLISGFVLYMGQSSLNHQEYDQFQNELIAEAMPTLTQIAFLQMTPQQEESEVAGAPELEPTLTPPLLATTVSEESVGDTPSPQPDVIEETPAPQKYYTEEFDGNLDAWPYFLTRGDENVVNFYLDSGKLFFQLMQQDEKKPWVYLVNNTFTYTDVQLEALTENSGVNSNGVSLVCRYNQAGWYEFTVSNGGEYIVYAHDAETKTYHELAKGGSPVINTGQSANTYTAVCKESELALLINGEMVTTTFDKRFNFAEGFIGLAVVSPQGLPVSVDFEYLKISEP